jgi:ABC-type transport system involved in cytochrome bd biosynthesis fused ATPase/permease subunit
MAEKIFVSYAFQDRRLVETLEQTLREHGIVTEKDVTIVDPKEEVQAGQNIRDAIRDKILSASMVVIIMSDNSAKSERVNYEAGMAAALEKPIVVIGRKGSGKSALLGALGDVQSIEIEEKG